MNNNQEVCENCGNSERRHVGEHKWCEAEWFIDGGRWKPKPTPDPKVEQVAKRPVKIICIWCNHAESGTYEVAWEAIKRHSVACGNAPHMKQQAKIESLEEELRVYKRAFELSSENHTDKFARQCLEAARKEQG